MSRVPLPDPSLWMTQQQARRFFLAAHHLLPPRSFEGKNGVLQVIRSLRAIQFDPINIVGRNPDLVLQSRVQNYRPGMLDDLLYRERKLLDGWDKMASIYPREDWPYFARQRNKMAREHGDPDGIAMQVAPEILERIRKEGPQSSLDFKGYDKADWSWGPAKTSRVALEALYGMGVIGIHHRENSRRYFDLIEHLLPDPVREAPDPNRALEEYQAWHIRRRIGSLKLAQAHAGAHWSGIMGVKSRQRRKILHKLWERGEIRAVGITEIPGRVFFIQDRDAQLIAGWEGERDAPQKTAFIAPLDNLMWHRDLIEWLFDFKYTWEVYKPAEDREYGYYVLPVIHGDRFVARVEPVFERDKRRLMIQGWWWEEGIDRTDSLGEGIVDCLRDFMGYLGAEEVGLDPALAAGWLGSLLRRIS